MKFQFVAVCVLLSSLFEMGLTSTNVEITYLGHSAFKITSPSGITLIIDPYENSAWSHWFLASFPETVADVLLISHDHFDHSAQHAIVGAYQLIETPSEHHMRDIKIRALKGNHARSEKYGSSNIIFLLEIEGLKICHLGDNGTVLSCDIVSQLYKPDILFVPVDDSEHLLDFSEVDMLIDLLDPHVIIPMHYRDRAISSECSPLGDIDNWLRSKSDVLLIDTSTINVDLVTIADLPGIWVLKPRTALTDGDIVQFLPCFLNPWGRLFLASIGLVAMFWIVAKYLSSKRVGV